MIIYAPDEEKNIPVRYKIGDGETPIYDLPFVTSTDADTLDGKHADEFTTVHIGSTQPTDGSDFWIDPNGAPTSVEDWSFELEDGTNDTKTVVVMDSDDAAEGDKAAILRVKQADGSYTEIPALIGSKGDPGTPGSAATVEIGSVTTGAAGSSASVTNSGTAQAAKLNFTIPKGEKGDPGDDGIASVTTTGTGNVITGLSYNESTKVLTATKGTVTAEDLGLTSPMEFIGTSDVSIEDGDVTNPITIDGVSTTVSNGNVAIYGAKEFIWNGSAWEEFGNEGNYKVKQQADSKTATATQTIKSISQNENGNVTVETQDIAFPVTSVNSQTGDVTIDVPTALADLTADSTHRTVTDDEKAAWNAKSNFSGNYNDLTNKPSIPTVDSALSSSSTNPVQNKVVKAALDKKMDDFSIEIYNGTGGNPKPVRFASFNYSTCVSEEGIAAKISLVSGHGNGTSYAFLEDAIFRVNHLGQVSVDTFKYYGTDTGTYDGAQHQYGDIFWLHDTTNKIVDFYVLMGQYARVQQTPWKRLTYSSKGTVTQYTTCTVYSSGEKVWANNSEIATLNDIPAVPTTTENWTFTLEDGSTVTKAVYVK